MNDIELTNAIRRAAPVFAELAGRMRTEAASGALADLVHLLRAQMPLSPDDADYLADLLSGELSLPPGRRGLPWEQRLWRLQTVWLVYQLARRARISFERAANRVEAALRKRQVVRRAPKWQLATADGIRKFADSLSKEDRRLARETRRRPKDFWRPTPDIPPI